MTRRPMTVSPLWIQGSILTFIVGFGFLGFSALRIYQDSAPIPERIVDEALANECEARESRQMAWFVDATVESFVFEVTGKPSKIDSFIALMVPLGLIEVVRTGLAAISRGAEGM